MIVVGEGIAGLACARHAASLGLKTATTEGNLFGGLVINIAELEGYDEHGSGVDRWLPMRASIVRAPW